MISTFNQAQKYLFAHIPDSNERKFPGEQGLARMRALVSVLGNPQEKYPVIHIAGTSGKGSTATLISTMIASQGFKVGLHLSPHLLDIRERIQINNTLLSKEKFVAYLNEIIPAVEKVSSGEYGAVTYFEILVALAYYTFWKEKVQYAVIETGMGGRFDGTNIVQNPEKLSVITKIGYDHTTVLGKTLSAIAWQKAGIIHYDNRVITVDQPKSVSKIIKDAADTHKGVLIIVNKKSFSINSITEQGTIYYDNKRKQEAHLGLIGAHQAENAMVAREVISQLSKREKWEINEESLVNAVQNLHLPGRMDIVHDNKSKLIIDGAHNKQKMNAFLSALTTLYPGEKFTFLVAFKHGKDSKQMIELLEEYAKEIIVTDFWVDSQDMLNISESIDTVVSYVKNIPVTAITGPKNALAYAQTRDSRIVITGSLYFSAEIYEALRTG